MGGEGAARPRRALVEQKQWHHHTARQFVARRRRGRNATPLALAIHHQLLLHWTCYNFVFKKLFQVKCTHDLFDHKGKETFHL